MINPLTPVYEWFLSFYMCLPLAFRSYINLYWIVGVIMAVVMALWRTKH